MIAWRAALGDVQVMYSPIGLLLIDDLTGKAPFGALDTTLELQDGPAWREVERKPVVTASGVLIYPGLGRSVDAAQPPQRYRVSLASAIYRGLYRAAADAIEFDVHPYDDTHPPAVMVDRPSPTMLLPAANYPFASHLPVLRGTVQDAAGAPVADVLVQESLRERTLTDERGAFSLSLRWVTPGVPTLVTADDARHGRAGSVVVMLPAALEQGQTITVS